MVKRGISHREKEEMVVNDYNQLREQGLRSTEAVRQLMEKYSYCYEVSIYGLLRRYREREKGVDNDKQETRS